MIRLSVLSTILIILSGISSTIDGANLINREAEQNGVKIDLNQRITSSTPVSVFLTDKSKIGTWRFEVLDKGNVFRPVDYIEPLSGYCVIEPKNFKWSEAFREFDDETNRDYFIFRLTFADQNDITDELIIKWGLLPSRPLLSDFKFIYQYNWEYDMIYPNGDFSFRVESEDAETYWLHFTDSFLYGPPFFFATCCIFDAKSNERIGYDADWGEFVNVAAQNRFGYVHSDTVCTTNFITDTEILDRINAIAGIDQIPDSNEDPFLSFHDDHMYFKDRVDLSLYDIAGNNIITENNNDDVDLSGICKGVYIAIYRRESILYKNKIYKK